MLAPLDRVWSLTEDLESWPALTPTMTSVERLDDGPLGPGSRARVVQPRQRPAIWRVRSVEPPRAFVWETTTSGVRLVAGHHLTEVEGGTRNLLVLDALGAGGAVVGRVAAPLLRRALATENDGFRRAAEGLDRPTYVDEHSVALAAPVPRAWDAARSYVDDLLERGEESRLTGLLATDPPRRLRGHRGAAAPPGQPRRAAPVLRLRARPAGLGPRVTVRGSPR